MEFSSIQNFQSPSINRTKLVFSFKLHNLSSYTYYRIEVWQPVGLLFGNYDHIVNRKLSYSISSNWFKTGVKPPNTSPSMVYAQIIDSDRMKITWQPLSRENWNGIPKGFLITIQENQSKHTVNSFTTYPNHEHMFSLNGTINIQKVQSHCGLVYLQVFINDSTASDYTVNNLKCDGEYSVTIRAASIQTGISDKWLLGPEMTVTPVLVNKQVTKKTDVRVPLWLTKTYYAGYNLKVSYTDEWIILKWKESLAVECGEPPSGYHLIFKKISSHAYVNATFQYGDSPSYVKFIPFNDTNLFRSKTMQSSDSFYENVLKLSLKSFFDVEGRLLLRRIIPLSRQKHDSQKARVLITWIPKAVNQRSFLRYATTFTLQWVRIDPISYENLSLPSTRIISWPEANNHIMLNDEFLTSGALTAAESKSSLKQNQQKHYSEYLIAIDELLMDTTYLFQLIESNSNQVNNATLNNSEECSKRTELLVYVTTVESYQTVPKIPPATPSIQILPSSTAMIDSQHTLCPSTSIHLSWPNYLSQLQSNETTESGSGFIYTSPVTNYTLQYAEINKDNFHDDISYHRSSINYTSVTWANYYPSPNFGDENDFVVNG
ncbi:unnamed protein product [Trichobilharzia regenti]|nr:unnamed protein product [Trichobilharzia regenti]